MLSSLPDFPISWSLCLASCDNMNSIHEDTWELREMEEDARQDRGDSDASSVIRSEGARLHQLVHELDGTAQEGSTCSMG